MRYTLLHILLIASLGSSFAQHNSVYTQYIFNGLVINPAYAGSNDALSLTGLYRNQWLGIDGSPQTITFSAHSPLKNMRHNVGINFISDRFGISSHNITILSYAYRVKFLKGHLALGLQAGADITRINWNNIRTTQENDPSFTGTQVLASPVAGCGIYYSSARFFFGLSAPSMIANNTFNVYQTSILYTGGIFSVGEYVKIKPALLIKYVKNSPPEADALVTIYLKEVVGLGAGYRLKDAVFAFLDLKVNEQFRIGYAYDYSVSALRRYTAGSHELMLRYIFLYRTNSQSARYF